MSIIRMAFRGRIRIFPFTAGQNPVAQGTARFSDHEVAQVILEFDDAMVLWRRAAHAFLPELPGTPGVPLLPDQIECAVFTALGRAYGRALIDDACCLPVPGCGRNAMPWWGCSACSRARRPGTAGPPHCSGPYASRRSGGAAAGPTGSRRRRTAEGDHD